MFLLLTLSCLSEPASVQTHTPEVPRTRVAVRVCAILDPNSPTFPSRLTFLHRLEGAGLDAQSELTAVDASTMRCGDVPLYLPKDRDGTKVFMDFMAPIHSPPRIEELRVYNLGTSWSAEDPFVVAVPTDEPFADYVFSVNLVTPSMSDPSTLLVR